MVLLERDLHLKALRSALSEAGKEGRVALFIAGASEFSKNSEVFVYDITAQLDRSPYADVSGILRSPASV